MFTQLRNLPTPTHNKQKTPPPQAQDNQRRNQPSRRTKRPATHRNLRNHNHTRRSTSYQGTTKGRLQNTRNQRNNKRPFPQTHTLQPRTSRNRKRLRNLQFRRHIHQHRPNRQRKLTYNSPQLRQYQRSRRTTPTNPRQKTKRQFHKVQSQLRSQLLHTKTQRLKSRHRHIKRPTTYNTQTQRRTNPFRS